MRFEQRLLLQLALAFVPGWAVADEALTWDGQRVNGVLRGQDFVPGAGKRPLRLEELRTVRFADHPAPLARCRLRHQLILSGGQQLTGELLGAKGDSVRFRDFTGRSIVVARKDLEGIVVADGQLVLFEEDFESEVAPAERSRQWTFSAEHAFSGKQSLLVNRASQQVRLPVPIAQKPRAAHRATVHFYTAAAAETTRARLAFVFDAGPASVSIALRLTDKHFGPDNNSGYKIGATAGWHICQIDWAQGGARAFIDDYLIDSQKIPMGARLAAVQVTSEGKGAVWLDTFALTERLAPLKHAPGPAKQDELWLASGDQVFGTLRQADDKAVVFDAPFGQRAYPWRALRGVFFETRKEITVRLAKMEVRFRPGPGMSADQLQGDLVDLNERRLLLRHEVLGELDIERTRLERVRFPEGAGVKGR